MGAALRSLMRSDSVGEQSVGHADAEMFQQRTHFEANGCQLADSEAPE